MSIRPASAERALAEELLSRMCAILSENAYNAAWEREKGFIWKLQ
jgi:hypothetical protein